MPKGQTTKAKILQQASELFNQKGYAGSSMADVMRVTGLQKGGIYNHFQSKDDLALAAFDYAIALVRDRQNQLLRGQRATRDRLYALVDGFYQSWTSDPLIPGGCPLLNTAIESDDAHPALKAKAQAALKHWHLLLAKIVMIGLKKGEVHAETDPSDVATIIISGLEGAMMMTHLSGEDRYLKVAIAHLLEYIDRFCVQEVNSPS